MSLLPLLNNSRKISRSLQQVIHLRSYHEGKPKFSGTFNKLFSEKDKNDFMNTLPSIIQEMTSDSHWRHKDIPLVNDHMVKNMEYNTPWHGWGLQLPYSYRMLMNHKGQVTEENMELARIMGWCVEFGFCYFITLDDIMDHNVRRRGRPVWHSSPDVGLMAMNDGCLLECTIYETLYRHFRHKPYYMDAVREFQTTITDVAVGQSLDNLMPRQRNPDGGVKLETFSLDVNRTICHLKSGLILYSCPGSCALIMAGYNGPYLMKKAKDIYHDMGYYVQAQNDFEDYFRDQELAEEDGTDIMTGKCSWPIAMAVQTVDAKQMKVLQENYGFADKEKIARVYQIYEDINMPQLFSKWEAKFHAEILEKEKRILKEEPSLPPAYFSETLEKRLDYL